jgi:predicted porin
MQKKLLGMAVATALAAPAAVFAQSAVQVYGTAHMAFNSTKYGAGTFGEPSKSMMSVTSHASNFGIRSSESLGGGMTGWVQYEFNVKMERDNDLTSGNGTSRNTAIGLRGNWGNAYLGTWETPWASTFRLWDVGTIGGWGPTTSVIGRRETTASSPSKNCAQPIVGGGTITSIGVTSSICYHGEGASSDPAGAYPLWRRYGSAAFYDSPVFSGFQFKIGYQPNEARSVLATNTGTNGAAFVGTTSKNLVVDNASSWSSSLTWTGMGGKARAFVANMQTKDWTSVGQTDGGYTVGGGFDFGVVNVGVTYETYTYKTSPAAASATNIAAPGGDSDVKQYGIGLAIPLGSGKIGVSYAIAKDVKGGNFGTVLTILDPQGAGRAANNGAKMYNVGYEWALSKRTALGFGYAKIDNDQDAAFTWTGMAPSQDGFSVSSRPGSDVSNIFVAVRHSF